jgi:hypothetical protein
MGSTWTEEQARATLKPFLLGADLELMTSKVAKKHMEEKLGVKVSKGDESKAFAKLCLSITTEILKKRKAAAALPPDSSEDEARPADSSEDEKAKRAPAKKKSKSKPASPVAADERPEWVRPTKGPRDTDDSEMSDDEPPAKPVATKKARPARENKVRPRATKPKKSARAGDSSDEDEDEDEEDSSGSEIMSGDEAVIGAGGAAGALYVPLAKQRAPRATTSRFAEGRPTKKAMQP